MDLHPSPEDVAFRAQTRRWLEVHVPRGELKTVAERKAWHARLYEAGYIGMGWPREYGGRRATPMEQAIAADELARVNAPPHLNHLGISIVGPTIVVHGTEAQKRRYLEKILRADELWCQLYSEPNAGSDLASLRTRAEDRGDHFVVNVENAHAATYYAAWALDADAADAAVAASVAKAYVGEAARTVCGEAIQVHGGIGFTWEYDLHLYFKRAKALEATYGDGDYHRELIVRRVAPSGRAALT